MQLQDKKSPGLDLITPTLLKKSVGVISPVLQRLFSMSLCQQSVPEGWKSANIVPVFKAGDR